MVCSTGALQNVSTEAWRDPGGKGVELKKARLEISERPGTRSAHLHPLPLRLS